MYLYRFLWCGDFFSFPFDKSLWNVVAVTTCADTETCAAAFTRLATKIRGGVSCI
jgi:hypothetical protein